MDLSELPDPAGTARGIEIQEAGAFDTGGVLELVAWRCEVPKEVVPKVPGVARAFEVGVPGNAVWAWRGS